MRLFPHRTGDPGKKWALWRWYDIVLDGELYLRRLNLLKTPWFSIKLHWILRPDPDRDLHDHPWVFLAFVLSGGYTEYVSKEPRRFRGKARRVDFWNFKNKKTAHRIASVEPNTVTLVISGPKDRKKEWGFYDAENLKFTHWRDYTGVGNGQ